MIIVQQGFLATVNQHFLLYAFRERILKLYINAQILYLYYTSFSRIYDKSNKIIIKNKNEQECKHNKSMK